MAYTMGLRPREISRITLTASGGPFREWPAERFNDIRPRDALDHPTWSMGPRITIDSATLMNKGLELIEACHLFDLPADRIDAVVHPQSIVHSMVEFRDGSVVAGLRMSEDTFGLRIMDENSNLWSFQKNQIDSYQRDQTSTMPSTSSAVSVVVPPTSTTRASFSPVSRRDATLGSMDLPMIVPPPRKISGLFSFFTATWSLLSGGVGGSDS